MKLSNGLCKICQLVEEDFEHMISKCQGLNEIWEKIRNVLAITFPNIVLNNKVIFFGWTSDNNYNNTVVNTVVSIARWEIWKRRCKKRYDDKLITISSCQKRIHSGIREHLSILEKRNRDKLNKMVDTTNMAIDQVFS